MIINELVAWAVVIEMPFTLMEAVTVTISISIRNSNACTAIVHFLYFGTEKEYFASYLK